MCTVTVLPEAVLAAARLGSSDRLRLRVACNRDELLTRAAARPPAMFGVGNAWAVMPIDPDSGGTWIGANDAGLVCVLLNASGAVPVPAAALSRGTIIPPLLGCRDLDAVLTEAKRLSIERYRPFRLLVIYRRELMECWPANERLELRREPLREAIMRSSSALGDAVAAGPRSELFRTMFGHASNPVAAQDLFHVHQWRGREAISVRMHRADAKTVSHTVVEVGDRSVRVTYRQASAAERVAVTMAA